MIINKQRATPTPTEYNNKELATLLIGHQSTLVHYWDLKVKKTTIQGDMQNTDSNSPLLHFFESK